MWFLTSEDMQVKSGQDLGRGKNRNQIYEQVKINLVLAVVAQLVLSHMGPRLGLTHLDIVMG